ncbi:MAG: polysaccharide deacetylase family protein [Acidimicrobiia bacterium]|nr:polysaccharide deacetylase family protein [Acidimicrobiia bacterium]
MRPVASLSLDLDNRWSYLKIHGDAAWESYPSYLDVVVPHVLDVLSAQGLRITVFVVGQDAAFASNREPLRALAEAGHEIGNHSFRHEPWLHRYSEAELDDELARAEEAIEAATGVLPRGFRGPGYSLSTTTLRVLARRGYEYDASTLPTYIGPLARAFYFRSAQLSEEQRRERRYLFGTARDGRRPVRPYHWQVDGRRLLEIPVTTMPVLKVPIHVSYLLFLATYAPWAARAYLGAALGACRLARVGPSLLLHPLDFVGTEEAPDLSFLPGMAIPTSRKLELVGGYLARFRDRFDVRPVGEHAAALRARPDLAVRAPDFPADGGAP